MSQARLAVFKLLLWRYSKERYLQNWAGPLWIIAVPLAQLAIYAYVFVEIFKARVPQADTVGFVPYLAIAFWPWLAFADSVQRATGSVVENRDLIGKVAVPTEILPLASATSTFLLTLLGYVAVLIVLTLTGVSWEPAALPLLLLMLVAVFLLTASLSLLFSAVQVYMRDLQHALGPLFMLWFFATPILYSLELVPAHLREWAKLNPFYYIVERIRDGLLFDGPLLVVDDAVFVAGCVLTFAVCYTVFVRLSRHFEDYL